MPLYKPFDDNVEVRGETVLSIINGVEPAFKNDLNALLKKNGISDPQPGLWYKQSLWLATMSDIEKEFGSFILYKIGKAIPENAIFPQGIKNLKEALLSINHAYKYNHRGGEIGYYKLIEWNEKEKKAVMECKNPYPCHFDRGIITKAAITYTPENSNSQVFLDINKPNRLNNYHTSWYIILWQ